MPSNHLILCHPLLLLPSIFPRIRDFSKESALHIMCPKYWSFSFNINPSVNTQDWFYLGCTGWISLQSKGLFQESSQHHSSKASILLHSGFFIVQLSYLHMTTGKTIALTSYSLILKSFCCFDKNSNSNEAPEISMNERHFYVHLVQFLLFSKILNKILTHISNLVKVVFWKTCL